MKGSWTQGIHTASTGRVTMRLGMKRKAMTMIKNHAQKVCTILEGEVQQRTLSLRQGQDAHHLWRVAVRTVELIHQPRMARVSAARMGMRKRA